MMSLNCFERFNKLLLLLLTTILGKLDEYLYSLLYQYFIIREEGSSLGLNVCYTCNFHMSDIIKIYNRFFLSMNRYNYFHNLYV